VEEYVSGQIATEPAGGQGFGYDPIFVLPDLGKTMGEIPPTLKNRLSHRGRALARLLAYLEGHPPRDEFY
jgi:XTP/dITP diphosphohydrolase